MNVPRTFVVKIEVLVTQTLEIEAKNEEIAEEIALDTFSLIGAQVVSAAVRETEEVTLFRGAIL